MLYNMIVQSLNLVYVSGLSTAYSIDYKLNYNIGGL